MKKFANFEEFWPFYLSEHQKPATRTLHHIGTTCAAGILLYSLATANFKLLPWFLVAGYGPAWFAHFFIEKNQPASWKYPLYSFRGDMRMWSRFLTGKSASLSAELKAMQTLSSPVQTRS